MISHQKIVVTLAQRVSTRRRRPSILLWASLLLAALPLLGGLGACGQKGPLVLPSASSPASPAPTPSSPARTPT